MNTLTSTGIPWSRIGLLVLGLVGITAVLSGLPQAEGVLLPAASLLLISIPAGIFLTYVATLRRIHRLATWSDQSLLIRFFSGPWLRFVWGLVGLALVAVFIGLRLAVINILDASLILVGVLVFIFLWSFFGDRLRSQWRHPFRDGFALSLAALITALLMSVIDPGLRLIFLDHGPYSHCFSAVEQLRDRGSQFGQSHLSMFMSDWAMHWVACERFVLWQVGQAPNFLWPALGLMMLALTKFGFYLLVALTAAAFFVPKSEYARILLPAKDVVASPVLTSGKIMSASMILTVLLLFALLPLVAVMESVLKQHAPEEPVSRLVEQIGDSFYKRGTIEEIERARLEFLLMEKEFRVQLDRALDEGFLVMRSNVEAYLDWYYSLPGEWLRIGSLLVGGLESQLTRRIAGALEQNDPFGEFENVIEKFEVERDVWTTEFIVQVNAILDRNRMPKVDGEKVSVVEALELESAFDLSQEFQMTTVSQRLGISAGAMGIGSIVAAVVTRQVLANLASQGVIRGASMAIVRVLGTRVVAWGTGAAGGAAAGAGAGSVVPGIGNAVGAVAGGIVGGIGVGVGAEYLMLKLEERFKREEHRAHILRAIDQAEMDLREMLAPILEGSE